MVISKNSVLKSLLLIPLLFFSFPFVSASGLETGAVYLPTFILIGVFSLLFFIAGFSFEQSFLIIIGTVLLFVMGFVVNAGNLYLPTGETYFVYGNNFTDYHWDNYTPDDYPSFVPADKQAFLFSEEKVYEPWSGNNNHLIGWLIMFAAVVLFALALINSGGGDEY